MPCYSPLSAWQQASGAIVFVERGDILRSLALPCGRCIGCRLERSRQWAMRCVHEASLWPLNCAVTLTYRDSALPFRGSLCYLDFQLFMKRLRKTISPVPVRFFMCGEYGDLHFRPHYHACFFGLDFLDKKPWKTTPAGSSIFRSSLLEKLWPHGHSSVGEMNFASAAYVARYVMKKRLGFGAAKFYERVDVATGEVYSLVPEFTKMSLKPGIGSRWFDKFRSDVFPHDFVVINGKEVKPPKFYDRRLALVDPDMSSMVAAQRELDAYGRRADNTDARLAVKAQVATARSSFSYRSLK